EVGVPFLRGLLRGVGIGPNDREDVLHDILLAAYRNLETFDASRLLRALQGRRDEDDFFEDDFEDEDHEPLQLSEVLPWIVGPQPRRVWDSLYRWLYGIAWRQVSHYRDRAYRRREFPEG